MTYGADFRPGSKCLPRHDMRPTAPLAAYKAYFADKRAHPRGIARTMPCPAKFRRVVMLVDGGESLSRACELVGVQRESMDWHIGKMPRELLGFVLAQRVDKAVNKING